MNRLFCLVLVAAFVTLASDLPVHAQPKKDQPKPFTNSIGMKFVWISPGNFMMGSPKEEKERVPGWPLDGMIMQGCWITGCRRPGSESPAKAPPRAFIGC
jgi:hypothetical protein